jgi:RNA polymerase sigma factor (sigma-70 family)
MYFPTTRWTLLAKATLSDEPTGRAALDDLCRRYWKPLSAYIRMRGYGATEAEDLTQEFIMHVMQHATLTRVDRERGKFRTFLLGSLNHFLNDMRDKRRAAKRGGTAEHEPLSETGATANASVAASESTLFDREWALTILRTALGELRAEVANENHAMRFDVLQRFLPGSLEVLTYDAAAEQLGLSVPAVKRRFTASGSVFARSCAGRFLPPSMLRTRWMAKWNISAGC